MSKQRKREWKPEKHRGVNITRNKFAEMKYLLRDRDNVIGKNAGFDDTLYPTGSAAMLIEQYVVALP